MFTSQTVSAVEMLRSDGDSSDCGTLHSTVSLEKLSVLRQAPPTHLEGVIGVRSFPIVWITLLPQTHSPVQMPTPP